MREYSKEEIINSEDSKVLKEILMRGKDDQISREASFNPNCPPEALAEVLKRDKDDLVSRYAVNNPNCPSEVLAEVIKRRKDDDVSLYALYAAMHQNCPPEVLAEVLRRGKDDQISRYAAKNPNCPPKERLEWYEATGKLTKYDPKIHELEHTKEDKDLEELKKLL